MPFVSSVTSPLVLFFSYLGNFKLFCHFACLKYCQFFHLHFWWCIGQRGHYFLGEDYYFLLHLYSKYYYFFKFLFCWLLLWLRKIYNWVVRCYTKMLPWIVRDGLGSRKVSYFLFHLCVFYISQHLFPLAIRMLKFTQLN